MTAVDALMDGLVDYAGLFPPASQDMQSAVESYASYRAGADRRALGRFIVPVDRLAEFEDAARRLMPRGAGSEPWRLSVLVGANVRTATDQVLKFNCHHWSGSDDGHAVIDAVELKAGNAEEIDAQHRELPAFFQQYFEIPLGENVRTLVKGIARVGARAKVRTGGITPDAFPAAGDILNFIIACQAEGVAFKATAGLHHPIRGSYRLTYKPDSDTGTMYGFLNVFLAAALIRKGVPAPIALHALEESDPAAFEFSNESIAWRGHRLSASELGDIRGQLAISFGSCSFREPVDGLSQLVSAHA
ncbi:MAG: hypothetical protein M3365_11310 [Gemmatimonadota bacterium]|nr:hypothetical protein [Gemmatimonadota bacterium]